MQKSRIILFITIAFSLITIFNFIFHVYTSRNDIFKRFDGTYWTKRYFLSQWVVPNSKNSIGDDGLYMYEGYRYMQGDDPTLLSAEVPPLGKYFIGLFETVTGFNGIFSVFFAATSLLFLFLLNKSIFKSSFLAIIPVMFFSFEPLFTSQIRAPYLDTLYLTFLLLAFLTFVHKKYLLAGISLGAFMATKSPFVVILVYLTFITYMIIVKKFSLRSFVVMVVSTVVIFLLTYSSTYLHGHGLLYILKVQKYMIHFYAVGAKAVIGAIFPLLFVGKWYTWFSPVLSISEWSIIWPVISILSAIGILKWMKDRDMEISFLPVWIIFYLLFLTFAPIFARYLLLLIPFLYNLSIWILSRVIRKKSS